MKPTKMAIENRRKLAINVLTQGAKKLRDQQLFVAIRLLEGDTIMEATIRARYADPRKAANRLMATPFFMYLKRMVENPERLEIKDWR